MYTFIGVVFAVSIYSKSFVFCLYSFAAVCFAYAPKPFGRCRGSTRITSYGPWTPAGRSGLSVTWQVGLPVFQAASKPHPYRLWCKTLFIVLYLVQVGVRGPLGTTEPQASLPENWHVHHEALVVYVFSGAVRRLPGPCHYNHRVFMDALPADLF